MFPWPTIELTDYERKYVRIYKTKDKPGVLNRVYKLTLNSQAIAEKNLPTIKLSDQVQIARRSRVYGLTFGGNIDRWRLQITNASGTLFTVRDRRFNLDPIVSSMLPCSIHNALSLGSIAPPLTITTDLGFGIGPAIQQNPQHISSIIPFPLLIDPNWILLPNETLIFNGTPLNVTIDDSLGAPFTPPLVLNIGIHVWEFPVMGTADIEVRKVV